MAEPARKLEDTNSAQEEIKPKFGVIEGGGETTEPKKGHLSSVPNENNKNEDKEKSAAQREAETSSSDGSDTESNEKEKSLSDDAKEKIQTNFKSVKKRSSKSKIVIMVLITSLIVSVFGAAFLLPTIMLKTITTKLTDTFMGRAKYAVEQRAEKYVQTYVTKVIGGELRGTCGTTVGRDCVEANTPIGKLTQQWKTNRIEDRLFKNHGIEFQLDRNDRSKIRVFQNGLPLDGDGDFGRRSVVSKVFDVVDTETKFDGILTRRHIRSVLANKYGAKKFCIIACDQRDSLETRRLGALRRLKLKIYSQVAEIGASRTSAYLLCLTVNCSDADLKKSENDAIQKILARQSDEFIEELADDIDKLTPGNRSLSNLVVQRTVERLLAKVVSPAAAKAAASSVPLAGQIYAGATAVELYTVLKDKLEDREISKYLRGVNAQESALWATQILNMADDNQSRNASLEDQWATFQLLNGFSESRMWQEANGIEQKSSIECADGVILSNPDDPLVCPELQLQPTLGIEEALNDPTIKFIGDISNQYDFCLALIPGTDTCTHPRPRTIVRPALGAINAVLGFAGESFLGFVGVVTPGFNSFRQSVEDFVSKHAATFFAWASEKILPRVIDPDAEDQLALDQTGLGLDVLGNQFGRGDKEVEDASSIEGSVLTAVQQTSIDRSIAERKTEKMQNKSFFARYFDIKNPDSLAGNTTIALAGGLDRSISDQKLPSFNVAGMVLDGFTRTLGLQNKSYAALGPQDRFDLYGVTQYGCALEDPCTTIDPEELTPERCQEFKRLRLESAFENELTGETDYTVSNPCAIDEIIFDSFTKLDNLDNEVVQGNEPQVVENNGPITISGELAFPLAVTKSQVGGGIFRNGDTDQAGHPYIAYDLIAAKGTTTVSMTSGTVVRVSNDCGGNTAAITVNVPSQGISIWYGHQDPATVLVSEGQTVSAGTPLARLVDSSVDCRSGADHLHIDASINENGSVFRPGCSRAGCENAYRFRSIGPLLFDLYQELPN